MFVYCLICIIEKGLDGVKEQIKRVNLLKKLSPLSLEIYEKSLCSTPIAEVNLQAEPWTNRF